MMTRIDERKAVITLPVSGDVEYMNRLSRLTDDERRIIEEKISVPLKLADEIIMKVLDYHTVSDEEYMEAAKRLIDENSEALTDLAGL